MNTILEVLKAKGHRVLSTHPTASILQAVDAMCHAHVGALLVSEASVPVGVISERDVMTRVILARSDPAMTKVRDVMTRDIVCIGVDSPIEEAMAVMTERRCRHLPAVVDGKVVGIVSIGDLVRAASESQEYEIQLLHEYLEGRYPG